jgi:hypothetical protein
MPGYQPASQSATAARIETFGQSDHAARMLAFLDFEASSLSKQSFPIEVAWVFEDGRSESHLIRPAPTWNDWDPKAEAIHHIDLEQLRRDGTDHADVARRMVAQLDGHDLVASAPSWDGKWLSTLLRAAGLPRHRLRLRASGDARRECARQILAPLFTTGALKAAVERILESAERIPFGERAHRALADAEDERRLWLQIRHAAEDLARGQDHGFHRPDLHHQKR